MKYNKKDRFIEKESDIELETFVITHVGQCTYFVKFDKQDSLFTNEWVEECWVDKWFKKIETLKPEETKGMPYENLGLGIKQIGGNHYSKLKIDPYEYSMVNGLNPLQMNAIKYITRYPFKNGIEDLEKAKHTIDRLIEYEKTHSKV